VLALHLATTFIAVPRAVLPVANLVLAFLALGLPFYALFRGAEARWTMRLGWLFVGVGAGLQLAMILLANLALRSFPVAASLSMTLGQAGLFAWCLGAGGLVSLMLKDRNLLIPVAIFLAAFDIFLVLTPTGLTRIVMTQAPEVLKNVAYQVPKASSAPVHGLLSPLALVGPADLLFMAMFFACLHKFGLRARATLLAMIPTLVAYLVFVVLFGHLTVGRMSLAQLPALVPIGAVVLIANAGLFKLKKDEVVGTVGVAVVMLGLLAWGMTRPVTVSLVDEKGKPVSRTRQSPPPNLPHQGGGVEGRQR
jgi:hypothetical protein